MKKVMILGAGVSQLPLIQEAKRQGLYTIVTSQQGSYPGFDWADEICPISTTDVYEIVQAAERAKIAAVCTTGTDIAVKALAKTADTLGLPGVSYRSACIASNKYEMKQQFMEHGVRTAPFQKVSSLEEAYAAVERLGFPVMFKAVDSGASKGIVKVDQIEQVERAYHIAKAVLPSPLSSLNSLSLEPNSAHKRLSATDK